MSEDVRKRVELPSLHHVVTRERVTQIVKPKFVIPASFSARPKLPFTSAIGTTFPSLSKLGKTHSSFLHATSML